VFIGGVNIENGRRHCLSQAFESAISMNVGDCHTSVVVGLDNGNGVFLWGGFVCCCYGSHGAKLNVSLDCVMEALSLYMEDIQA
jgi:hypothetical protein